MSNKTVFATQIEPELRALQQKMEDLGFGFIVSVSMADEEKTTAEKTVHLLDTTAVLAPEEKDRDLNVTMKAALYMLAVGYKKYHLRMLQTPPPGLKVTTEGKALLSLLDLMEDEHEITDLQHRGGTGSSGFSSD